MNLPHFVWLYALANPSRTNQHHSRTLLSHPRWLISEQKVAQENSTHRRHLQRGRKIGPPSLEQSPTNCKKRNNENVEYNVQHPQTDEYVDCPIQIHDWFASRPTV